MEMPSPQRPFAIFASIGFLFLFAIYLILQPSLYALNHKQFFLVSQIESFISSTQEENPVPRSGNGTSNDGKESHPTDKTHSDATAEEDTSQVAAADHELSVDKGETLADGRGTVGNSFSAKGEENPVSNVGNAASWVREMKRCDLYRGRWVKDQSYPLYEPGSCPYVDEAFDCQNNRRPDSNYLRWRWKPDGCNLPRFNATDFLNRLRDSMRGSKGIMMNPSHFPYSKCGLLLNLV